MTSEDFPVPSQQSIGYVDPRESLYNHLLPFLKRTLALYINGETATNRDLLLLSMQKGAAPECILLISSNSFG